MLYKIISCCFCSPKCKFSHTAEVECCRRHTHSFEHTSHCREIDAVPFLQTTYLRTLHTNFLPKLFLSKVLSETRLSYRLSHIISVQFLGEFGFKSVTFGSADNTKPFIFKFFKCICLHLCHSLIYLELKYSFLNCSALSISFCGVFCVFLVKP